MASVNKSHVLAANHAITALVSGAIAFLLLPPALIDSYSLGYQIGMGVLDYVRLVISILLWLVCLTSIWAVLKNLWVARGIRKGQIEDDW